MYDLVIFVSVLSSSLVVFVNARPSLITHEKKSVTLCPYGNPGMATGGMGDVLSGMIAALIAQGLSKENALELAVCLHSKAGDIAAEQSGQRGLLATDLIPISRLLLNQKPVTT